MTRPLDFEQRKNRYWREAWDAIDKLEPRICRGFPIESKYVNRMIWRMKQKYDVTLLNRAGHKLSVEVETLKDHSVVWITRMI